ncbi:PHP domain-containing protein, partial [bacterium]|nr:PHP domain-containing protein [bacterium]
MTHKILVNLHCHSMFSDGELTPEALAEVLAVNNVRYASLTDHDTIEGLQRFQIALKKVGVEYIPGVELTTFHEGHEIHLLGYGFNVDDPDLNSAMLSIRQSKVLDNVSIAGSMRKKSTNHIDSDKLHHRINIKSGTLETRDAIKLIHQAGGCVILAHPYMLEKNPEELIPLIKNLKGLGLDGIEAIYAEYSLTDQNILLACADTEDLLVSAGTDFHTKLQTMAIEMERERWVKLRTRIFSTQGFLGNTGSNSTEQSVHQAASLITTGRHHHFQKRAYILRIFLPTFLAIALFLTAIWVFVIPSFENTLLDRKRELIRELTNSAISI